MLGICFFIDAEKQFEAQADSPEIDQATNSLFASFAELTWRKRFSAPEIVMNWIVLILFIY